MPIITDEQFNQLKGIPMRVGKADPNSMTNRILSVIPDKGAISLPEIRKVKKLEDIADKQLKTILGNLVNKKNKSGQTKIETKLDTDKDRTPYFRKVKVVVPSVPIAPIAPVMTPGKK